MWEEWKEVCCVCAAADGRAPAPGTGRLKVNVLQRAEGGAWDSWGSDCSCFKDPNDREYILKETIAASVHFNSKCTEHRS